MPLPTDPSTQWPPKEAAKCADTYAEHAAWYSANSQRLADFYSSAAFTPTPKGHLWARQTREHLATAVHMPLAADIASLSADLLFSEAPDFTIPEAQGENAPAKAKEAQTRLNELIEEAGILNKLLEAAETCSALGGVYLRPVWDAKLVSYPLLSIVQPDSAVPEFRWGILTAVTFWHVICEVQDGREIYIYRHLERHEVAPDGRGVILHALYKGKRDRLGVSVDLKTFPETADLLPAITTGIDGLDVRYIPNMLPNRLDRGSPLGSSDYQGKESLFASLDETWTSLVVELTLAKARIYVPEDYIDTRAQGDHTFDVDETIFVPLAVDPTNAGNLKLEVQQPDIRVEKHLAMAQSLVAEIVSRCGYAPQSFGIGIEGNAPSGTALRIRERKSLTTLGKKQRYWKTALQDIMLMLLQLDATLFNSGIEVPDHITLTYADSVAPDINELANTVNLLSQAQSASIEVRVRMLHPEWSDKEIYAEVDRIKEDQVPPFAADPTGGLDTMDDPKPKPGAEEDGGDSSGSGATAKDAQQPQSGDKGQEGYKRAA
jgi:A118 family predicted phage portal protein